ncbi:solute carrier family 28 member 3-like [Mercenaria mercenaria]|uniref:solute carrier family 28 member 3-like n=1 Tax=Mercenaria mercenaria TaxID=6596 RepID=UPI00234EF8A5|nr:solute carrier family 28 member 3-like [Mercenaria mercenaria]XP_045168426.2 solute carrier family 28 member 3-like [Mercenaria mercenaria]
MKSYKVTEGNNRSMDSNGFATSHGRKPSDCEKEIISNNKNDSKIDKITNILNDLFRENKQRFKTVRNIFFLVLYLAYYGYAMYCNFGDEPSIRLTVFTVFGLLCISWKQLRNFECFRTAWKIFCRSVYTLYSVGRRPKIIQWSLYFVWSALFLVYVIVNVALKDTRNLIPLVGIAVFILLMILLSNNRRRINWHCVFYGTILQCLFGLFVLKTTAGTTTLMWFSDRLIEFISYSDVGSAFVFGQKYLDHVFAMQVIPSIIVFVAVIQVLIYVGAVQFIVKLVGYPLAYILDVSAPEAMNAFANILLGGAESGATMYEYLFTMPTSRLFAICVGGLASCAGSNLIQYMAFGVPLKYLLAASAMSAPAALVCAKIVYPDTGEEDLQENTPEMALDTTERNKYRVSVLSDESPKDIFSNTITEQSPENIKEAVLLNEMEDKYRQSEKENGTEGKRRFVAPKSVGEALVVGTTNGLKLSASIIGLLIVSLAVIEMLNKTVEWFGDRVNVHITLNLILSYLFYPLVYIMGVESEDCLRAGEFLGLRTLSSPVIPYIYLGRLIYNRQRLDAYTAAFNETFTYDRQSDIFLPNWNMTLTGGIFSERSEVIVTYALCGFASIPTVGITFGLVTAFVPHRLPEITKLGFRLLVTGTVASYLTACVAGLLS